MEQGMTVFHKIIVLILCVALLCLLVSMVLRFQQENKAYRAKLAEKEQVERSIAPGGFTPLAEPTQSAAATPAPTPIDSRQVQLGNRWSLDQGSSMVPPSR